MKRRAALVVSLAAIAGVVSCGGGGDDVVGAPSGPSAEGYYAGNLSVSGTPLPDNSTTFQFLVLGGGQFWTIYGTPSGGALDVQGFLQGTGNSNGSLFLATDVRYFSRAAARTAAITANYNAAGKSISGTVFDDANSTVSFAGVPQAPSDYNYATAAALVDVAGNWMVEGVFGDQYDLVVAKNGAFTGGPAVAPTNVPNPATCTFTGFFQPQASGKNVFTVSVTNGVGGCATGVQGLTTNGIAFVSPVTGGSQLTFATVDPGRTRGAVLSGVR
ncbi:hypothetical protein [Hydrogenophaga sp.]|uniref:hypothetical protein n=1 Tax=Hydrogenophaga sp. TaxID=1904254 RepID=UPI0027329F16|nr:hypothetical protein [Hydrogenophaga sp.]MDP3108544.1 hypothetical protein [Hydrogenophaga sp.]